MIDRINSMTSLIKKENKLFYFRLSQTSIRSKKNINGFSLSELMIVVAIIGIIASIAPRFLVSMTRFIKINTARTEITRYARTTLELINRKLRQAVSTSVTLSRENASQPPYSKLTFTTIDGDTFQYYQLGNSLYSIVNGGAARKLSEALRLISFSYPRSDDDTIISVSVTFEKGTYESKTKAIQMAIEKVRIMN
jgi:prepilin-type N-terminal cleavage/methylation domain-containing protein